MKRNIVRSMIVTLCMLLFPLMASAGFLLKDPQSGIFKFGVRFLHPNFEQFVGSFTALTGSYDLSVSLPLGRMLTINGELPVANYNDGIDSENQVGNIYAGLQYRFRASRTRNLSISLGVYLPTLTTYENFGARLIAMDANFFEFFKYIPELTTLHGGLSYHHSGMEGFTFNLEAGGYMLSSKMENTDTQFLMNYGFGVGYRLTPLSFNVEFIGLRAFGEEGLPNPVNFNEDEPSKSMHAIAVGLSWRYGSLKPSVFYKIYLRRDFNDFIKSVVGFKLEFFFMTRRN